MMREEDEDDKLHRRRWAVEMSIWKNKYGSMPRILEDAEAFENWLLRDRKAEIHVIQQPSEKEKTHERNGKKYSLRLFAYRAAHQRYFWQAGPAEKRLRWPEKYRFYKAPGRPGGAAGK